MELDLFLIIWKALGAVNFVPLIQDIEECWMAPLLIKKLSREDRRFLNTMSRNKKESKVSDSLSGAF
jgi:hypothetical protein